MSLNLFEYRRVFFSERNGSAMWSPYLERSECRECKGWPVLDVLSCFSIRNKLQVNVIDAMFKIGRPIFVEHLQITNKHIHIRR